MVGPPSQPPVSGGSGMLETSSTDNPSPPSYRRPSPPEAWEPLLQVARLARRPLERFLQVEAASGILLLVAALVAFAGANSPWAESYAAFWHFPLGLRIAGFTFERPLEWFVNDGLMVIFFFVVGLEIRREVHQGELSEWRRAALPAAAALGGMVAPALLYLAVAGAPPTRSGWGVPMATDIAFAVGILALLGRRVSAALRVLLLALAVTDDLGAIVVIAFFYSSGVSIPCLLVAAAGLLGILLMQRFGVRSKWLYVVPAFVAWAATYAAGIHPTIAGVLVGLMTPVRAWLGPDGFLAYAQPRIDQLANSERILPTHELAAILHQVDQASREATSPAESLIETLHPWVAYGIMPVFARANAGVSQSGAALDSASSAVGVGVALGLLVGKPLGVLTASWLSLRLGIATLPAGMPSRSLVVLGVVAGVGFTMALFIAQLAFTDPALLRAAKLGVLSASAVAAVFSLILGRVLLSPSTHPSAAQTVDEAECSTEA
jgi:NhaA family Na+:H+ antiporter